MADNPSDDDHSGTDDSEYAAFVAFLGGDDGAVAARARGGGVGGDPPPPPPPSASDAAVQPRARYSGSSDDPPRSNARRGAGERPSDDEGNDPRVLDCPAEPNAEDVPLPQSQIAADLEATGQAIKESINDVNSSDIEPPLPPSQTAALAEEMEVEENEGDGLKKREASTTELLAVPPIVEQEEIIQQAQDPPTPAVARAPSLPPPTDQGRTQSTMPSPDEDANPPVSTLLRDPSVPRLSATLVEDQPEIPVYDGLRVAEPTRLEKNKKIIIGLGMGLLIGLAVAIGVSVGPNDGSSGSNAIEPEGLILSTARPSESSSPSEVPSLRPVLGPSRSLAPSTSLRPTASSRPSQIPSLRPSLRPSLLPSSPPSTYWSSLDWNRQGAGFNGEASGDILGQLVAFSTDALTMAIGVPGTFGNVDRPGYVKVYQCEEEGSSWEQRGETIHGEANGDYFGGGGLSLSEDGMVLSIGAPYHDSVGPGSGQVKVYVWDAAALNHVQIGDTLYGAAPGDGFGSSLDIWNGTILAVGSIYSDANGAESGQVAVYAWDEAVSNFKQRGEAIDGDAAGDWFGRWISLAGNGQKLAVGAPFNGSNGTWSGKVRVFAWDEAALNYEQLGDSLVGDAAGDTFGTSVSFSRDGTVLAIGAPFSSGINGGWSGYVKVFAWDEDALNFEQIGRTFYGKAADDNFGTSLALAEGKTLAVGAVQYDADKPGYVEVYEWDDVNSEYKRLGQRLDGESSSDLFGTALALAGNGRVLVVGAPWNDRNGTDSGRAEVFHIEI